jgi:hypothetical protein
MTDLVWLLLQKYFFEATYGIWQPDFEVAGSLRVSCGYVRLPCHYKKTTYSYPQVNPQTRKVSGKIGKLLTGSRVSCGKRVIILLLQ